MIVLWSLHKLHIRDDINVVNGKVNDITLVLGVSFFGNMFYESWMKVTAFKKIVCRPARYEGLTYSVKKAYNI